MNKKFFLIFVVFIICLLKLTTSCTHVKAYEKEYLVHPLMDDTYLSNLDSDFKDDVRSKNERLGSGMLSSSSATACPTCGG